MAWPPNNTGLNVNSRASVNGYISSFGLPNPPVFVGVHPGAEPTTVTELITGSANGSSPAFQSTTSGVVHTIASFSAPGLTLADFQTDANMEIVANWSGGSITSPQFPQFSPSSLGSPPITRGDNPQETITDSSPNLPGFTNYIELYSEGVSYGFRGSEWELALIYHQGAFKLVVGGRTHPQGTVAGNITAITGSLNVTYTNPEYTGYLQRLVAYNAARDAYNQQVSTFNSDRLRYNAFIAPANLNPGLPALSFSDITHNSGTLNITKGQYADSTDIDGTSPIPDETTTAATRTYTGLSPATIYQVRARARRSLNTQPVPPAQTPIS